jgi:hypothetical protein
MKRSLFLFLALMPFLSGCSTSSSSFPPGSAASAARKSITVVEVPAFKPLFFSMGLTAFNNHTDPISDPEFSISDYLVSRLKAKGYNARKGSKGDPGLLMRVFATYPYGSPSTAGVGVSQMRPVMMKWKVATFCNISADLVDPSTKFSVSQPIGFGGGRYFADVALEETKASRWAEFSAAEKSSIKSTMRQTMTKATDLVLQQLGL